MPATMRAARMHAVGGPMSIDTIAVPKPGSTDVLVEVKACGMVPNLGNVLANWTKWFPHLPLPKLPAIFGLDPAGVVVEVGSQVLDVTPGERVYVNPLRSCGACQMCRSGERTRCRFFTFNGYFGFGPDSQKVYDLYPYGGFCEFMTAPQYALVKLPDNVTFEQAARFGYLGTSYGAMKKADAVAGRSMLVDGISGTLGLGAALLGLAMGITRILGTGRNRQLLERVKKLAPDRIEVHALDDGATAAWAKRLTGGEGVDFMISALDRARRRAPCSIRCAPSGAAAARSMSGRWPSPFPLTCTGSWTSRSS
jgi:D-arabinose 1-dehydrogenase-like Zn-dependent alcohol dehydrogenase